MLHGQSVYNTVSGNWGIKLKSCKVLKNSLLLTIKWILFMPVDLMDDLWPCCGPHGAGETIIGLSLSVKCWSWDSNCLRASISRWSNDWSSSVFYKTTKMDRRLQKMISANCRSLVDSRKSEQQLVLPVVSRWSLSHVLAESSGLPQL